MAITCTIGGASAGGAVAVISPATITLRAGSWIRYRNFNWPHSRLTVTATLGTAQGNGQTANISLGRTVNGALGVANGEGKGAVVTLGSGGSTITFSDDPAGGALDISKNITLGKFDTNLGTLDSATLAIRGGISGTITLDLGAAGSPQLCIGIEGSSFFYSSSIGALNTIVGNGGSPLLTPSYSTGAVTLNPSTSNPFTGADTPSTTVNINGILASLSAAGGGTFLIHCSSFSSLSTGGGGGFLSATDSFSGTCGATIVYTYH